MHCVLQFGPPVVVVVEEDQHRDDAGIDDPEGDLAEGDGEDDLARIHHGEDVLGVDFAA